jgi:hypothetical protein
MSEANPVPVRDLSSEAMLAAAASTAGMPALLAPQFVPSIMPTLIAPLGGGVGVGGGGSGGDSSEGMAYPCVPQDAMAGLTKLPAGLRTRVWHAFVDAMRDPAVGPTAKPKAIRDRMGELSKLTPNDLGKLVEKWPKS